MSRTNWKTQYSRIESASKFHNKVREIFLTDNYFKNLKCFQEIPVSELVPFYPNRYHAIDWYVEELHTVIELHGKQHYSMVNFGGIGYDQAVTEFHNIQSRDNQKKEALIASDYEYRAISYKLYAKLNAELLKKIIFQL